MELTAAEAISRVTFALGALPPTMVAVTVAVLIPFSVIIGLVTADTPTISSPGEGLTFDGDYAAVTQAVTATTGVSPCLTAMPT